MGHGARGWRGQGGGRWWGGPSTPAGAWGVGGELQRESKREKNLDARAKELRVSKAKEAKAAEATAKDDMTAPVETPWEVKAKEVEDEFWKAVGDVDGV